MGYLYNPIELDADLDSPAVSEAPLVTQGDSIELTVNVLKSGEAFPLEYVETATLVVQRSDRQVIIDQGQVEGTNQVVFRMSKRATTELGTTRFNVQLYDENVQRITTLFGVFVVMEDASQRFEDLPEAEQSLIQQVLGEGPGLIEQATQLVGNVKYVGEYDNNRTYQLNNMVSYYGQTYIAKDKVKGIVPSGDFGNESWGLVARKGDLPAISMEEETFIASEGQQVFNLAEEFRQFQNGTFVTVDGVNQTYPENYDESTATSITLKEPVPEGTVVKVRYFKATDVGIDLPSTIKDIRENITEIATSITSKGGVGGGVVDATSIIQKTINDYQSILIDNVFLVSGTIKIPSNKKIEFTKRGKLISTIDNVEYSPILLADKTDNITIINPNIDGQGLKNKAIELKTATNITIQGGRLEKTGGHGIYLISAPKHIKISDIVLETTNMTLTAGIPGGIMASGAVDVTLENVTVNNTNGKGIGFTSNSKDCKITNCTVENAADPVSVGLYANTSTNIVYDKCTVINVEGGGLKFSQNANNCRLLNSELIGGDSTNKGILLQGAHGCVVANNLVKDFLGVNSWGVLVAYHPEAFTHASNNVIDGNTFINISRTGVQVEDEAENTIITNNYFESMNQNGQFNSGIYTTTTTKNTTITNNTIRAGKLTNKNHRAIYALGTNNIVANNNVLDGGDGTEIVTVSATTIIKDNIGFKTEDKGKAIFSAPGNYNIFDIPYTLVKPPTYINVLAGSTDANNLFMASYNAFAKSIRVTFKTNPVAGTDNITLFWFAETR